MPFDDPFQQSLRLLGVELEILIGCRAEDFLDLFPSPPII